MDNTLLLMFFLAHIIGDFYLQTETVARRKEEKFSWVLFHSILYALLFALTGILISTIKMMYIIVVAASHAAIDIAKYGIQKKILKTGDKEIGNEAEIFVVDQIVHILVILVVSILNRDVELECNLLLNLNNYAGMVGLSGLSVMRWTMKVLLIHKPMNIFISSVLHKYKPKEKASRIKEDKNAGRLIGTLERILILIFVSIEQYSAVGLVLTAKSIARYDKISKNQEFAEYYLLGTLMSTICAILVAVLL